MHEYVFAWRWLTHAAVGGFFVLSLGTLATLCCRQPVLRARVILLTVLAAFGTPWLAAIPITPKWLAPATLGNRRAIAPTASTKSAFVEQAAPPVATSRTREPIPQNGSGAATRLSSEQPTRAEVRETRDAIAWIARAGALPWETIALTTYLIGTAALAAWWLLGQLILWRVTFKARPAPRIVREAFEEISGRAGAMVRLLQNPDVDLPFTYTWTRSVIILPAKLCDRGDTPELRFCLAHEWSHIERHDSRSWNLTALAGFVLYFQPIFWWLKRQLRLCQDYLADDRAAVVASAEDYATYLVGLARSRQADALFPALGVIDGRSNLYRRIAMLVHDHQPLEHRCRRAWSLSTAAAAVVVAVALAGLSLDAHLPPAARAGAKELSIMQNAAKNASTSKPSGEALNYTGTVKDKDTDKPIAGARVTMRRSVLSSRENRVLEESKHVTGPQGTYSFTIPPEQVAERLLYIELDVEHPNYATRSGFGYALGMTRKNEKLGERPFFETIELRPAEPISARVETPDGGPAAGVEILAYSRTDKLTKNNFEYGSFARATTDAMGRFQLPITTPGQGVFWILPKAYAPQMHVLADGKRGELGTFTLKKGVSVSGRALNVDGKPLAGMFVEMDRERGPGPDFEALGRLTVADAIRRTAETDADGRFTFDPLPPGSYMVKPTDFNRKSDRSMGWTRRELPGVFGPTKLTINEGESPEPIEVRASPAVVIEGRWLDSKGQPKSGWGSSVFGRIDGTFWHDQTSPDEQGRFSLKVPHGLENVELDISTNEHASAQYRIGKNGPLLSGRRVTLGTLDHDVKDIEIVRYVAPIIIINATSKAGQQIQGFKASVEYVKNDAESDKRVYLMGGGKKPDALQDEQNDGRYRTSHLLPDKEVNVSVSADGFASASRKMSLPEGKIEEVNFVLDSK
jgi:beta-lactamase regulating signal transducer with metallopeptidase domain